MTPDLINGAFEAVGAGASLLNCWRMWRDRRLAGYSMFSTCFFTSWGLWNLFYYPAIDQWFSFAGGVGIVTANALWLGLAIYFTRIGRTA
jgi:hypothetical protein